MFQEVTHDVHYENFRSERLARQNAAATNNSKERYQPQGVSTAGLMTLNTSETEDEKERKLREKDAELKRMQEMVAAMQEQIKQQSQTSLPSLVNPATNNRY